ncbi:MAG: LysE family transporter, partial [Kiritimatiellae bacterium]|nr:LysE family transporter [Kiritimatiellia bacterium]
MKLWLYLSACLLVALAPGPDNCFVLAQSAAFGAPAGLAVTLGLMSGLCVHITLAVLGAATLLN